MGVSCIAADNHLDDFMWYTLHNLVSVGKKFLRSIILWSCGVRFYFFLHVRCLLSADVVRRGFPPPEGLCVMFTRCRSFTCFLQRRFHHQHTHPPIPPVSPPHPPRAARLMSVAAIPAWRSFSLGGTTLAVLLYLLSIHANQASHSEERECRSGLRKLAYSFDAILSHLAVCLFDFSYCFFFSPVGGA